jgi:hypothetical protein
VLLAATGSTGVANCRHDTGCVLLDAHQLGVPLDLAAKLHQALAKLGLDVGLRNEHGLPAVGRSAADRQGQLGAIGVDMDGERFDRTVGEVGEGPDAIQHLRTARLEAQSARASGRSCRAVCHPDLHAVVAEAAGQRQPGRPSPNDQDCGTFQVVVHGPIIVRSRIRTVNEPS